MIHKLMITLLLLAYFATLIMSTGHLAEWYALSLGKLPRELAWGLAGALEFTAFLLSLLSNSLLRQSRWAGGGALAALGLVWVGNALSMHRGAPELALWEVFLMSLFVPVGTYAVGKVVGELIGGTAAPVQVPRPVAPEVPLNQPVAHRGTAAPVQVPHQTASEVPQVPAVWHTHVPSPVPQTAHSGTAEPPQVPPRERVSEAAGTAGAVSERATLRMRERSVDLEWSVEGRAGELLSVMARYQAPVTLTVLVRDLGWPKSTVRRWLDRLEEEGLIRRTEDGWYLSEAQP
ncbi:helix-turn-helix domain-containing protein [Meiothermus taiwanensis]|uniref:helix-turn-helix domain-containing protein n=1 Tax=Meiothermus taiwanensis TaxID=172827 RepID=UPI0005B72F63|nr:helix-turn-helix domain-containing protein [Meiothermus taiwanensis]KIQ55838.1 hypothetical protein SY28_01050 [Meiothermus taiwanensis]